MHTRYKSVVLILGLSVFSAITTELGVVGVLPEFGERFGISVSRAGLLVSLFALVVALAGPFVALAVSGLNRKWVLVAMMSVFALSNVVYALSTNFGLSLLFRVIPALIHASLFSVAIAVAVSMARPGTKTKASAQVFAGVAIGLVLGVPITSFIAGTVNLEVAFLAAAAASAFAVVGIVLVMPTMPVREKLSYGEQLRILRKPQVWMNVSTVVFIFAAMFAVYSYFAEYLDDVTGLANPWTGVLLMVFGIFGVLGNYLLAALLHRNVHRTVMWYPLAFFAVYALVQFFGSYAVPMIALVVVWGVLHSGGLIVSQTWLSAECAEAPVFGNSLYLSFSNLGIAIGSAVGGWVISQLGTENLLLSGLLFSALAAGSILLRTRIHGQVPTLHEQAEDSAVKVG
ncbi:MFS transporter [Rhodococcus sp. NPDC057014]|uniref:MFS transporter n=1 Tax=Rhodococcus sp. NPDC057014 TaxID=3346000 RepID=UPI0036431F67